MAPHQPGGIFNFRIDSRTQLTPRLDEIITCLEIHSELRTVAKITAQPQRGLRCDCPLAVEYRLMRPEGICSTRASFSDLARVNNFHRIHSLADAIIVCLLNMIRAKKPKFIRWSVIRQLLSIIQYLGVTFNVVSQFNQYRSDPFKDALVVLRRSFAGNSVIRQQSRISCGGNKCSI